MLDRTIIEDPRGQIMAEYRTAVSSLKRIVDILKANEVPLPEGADQDDSDNPYYYELDHVLLEGDTVRVAEPLWSAIEELHGMLWAYVEGTPDHCACPAPYDQLYGEDKET